MSMEQFDTHHADHDEPINHTEVPVGKFVPLTPARSYPGGTLLGQLILGRTQGHPGYSK
jgi:hypothetical protein